MYGSTVSVAEVFKEVLYDRSFYLRSGGGVTASGGEPLLQAHFVIALFKMAHQAGINTAIETCGNVSLNIMKEVLDYTDYVMFDMKIMDSSAHSKIIGKTNKLILENAKLIASSGIPMLPRMPLVPGINDSEENIRATAEFLQSLKLPKIELMPFHRFASGKYEALGISYAMKDLLSPSGESVEQVKKLFKRFEVECMVSI
jgi:pyruvate formate lyase activating enzyme